MGSKIQISLIRTNMQNIFLAAITIVKPFKPYLGEDAVYSFINSMIKESKYYSEVMKQHFNKELVMTKKDNAEAKVGYHCHITGKYRHSGHRDCNTNVKLNQKISFVFHNVGNYDFHLYMQELSKFYFKINVIANSLENI